MKMTLRIAAFAAALSLTSAAAVSAEEMTLTFATGAAPGQAPHPQVSLPWAEEVNEAGKGVLKINVVQGFTVVAPQNFYARVQNDVVQIVSGLQGSVGGVFPLTDVARIPYLVEKAEFGSVAFWRLYETGLLDSDYKDVHPLSLDMFPQGVLHLVKPPKAIDDFAGLKLVANSKMTADIIEKLGATPITILIQETFQAMQRHTVDGTVTGYPAVRAFKFDEVAPYHLDAMLGGGAHMVVMAKKKWESLPAAVQKLLDSHSGEGLARRYGKANDDEWEQGRARLVAMSGQTVVAPTPAQHEMFKRMMAPIADDWVKQNPKGAEVLSKFRALLAQAKAEIEK
jgi:TRAP-type C4-dicarboxylate transport system substrate-binding protein